MSAAIKVLYARLEPDILENFLTEARQLHRLAHLQIVRLLDFGVSNETPYLIMEYAPNGTLRKRHPPGTSVALPVVVSYIQQIAGALQYAHEHKVLHRDLKPDNLLLA